MVSKFGSIRHTELPLYLYVMFPYVGFTIIANLFLLGTCQLFTCDSEDIRGRLLSYGSQCLRHMSRHERKCVLMGAKAFRLTEFPIGEFTDYTLNALAEEYYN